jgi:p-cumate 2,3-dioxygenase beta subunit
VPPDGDRLRAEVEDLLYNEADLLDRWQLREWLELLTDDVVYEVPATDAETGDLTSELGFIHDDRERLEGRVERLLSRHAHREFPWSRTRRLITNVRCAERPDEDVVVVHANFCVWRYRAGHADAFVGAYEHRLRRDGADLRIARRRAVLDLERLHPHGSISIIL